MRRTATLMLATALAGVACSPPETPAPRTTLSGVPLVGPLVPAHTTMVTAWDVPQDPTTDPSLDDSPLSEEIRWGYRLFTSTPTEAPQFTASQMSCSNCHLNVGQRERALPLVGVAGMFPEYNRRAGRPFTLTDRIVGCFLRTENATGRLTAPGAGPDDHTDTLPTPESREVKALAAFLTWLARDAVPGEAPPGRGRNTISADARVPLDRLDRAQGEAIFLERCTSCHGEDGQGVQIGDKKAGPLWGPDSWNDGAGAARVYTLAGIIRYMMPYLDPGSLTDEEAQHVAAFITSQPRPSYPFKALDYLTEPMPIDSVYYPPR